MPVLRAQTLWAEITPFRMLRVTGAVRRIRALEYFTMPTFAFPNTGVSHSTSLKMRVTVAMSPVTTYMAIRAEDDAVVKRNLAAFAARQFLVHVRLGEGDKCAAIQALAALAVVHRSPYLARSHSNSVKVRASSSSPLSGHSIA